MESLLDSPLAAAAETFDKPAVILDAGRVWTWRQVHAASVVLADRLRGASAVCNLAHSRLAFLVGCLAAWRNRCLLVLPPSGSSTDLSAVLAEAGGRPVVLGDPETWPDAWPDPQADFSDGRRYLGCRPDREPVPELATESIAWQPAWDDVAVRLYTSGSTGVPQAQPKTLRQLARGARVLAARLEAEVEGGMAAIQRIVCSVPPQHMFGLECSVMLPLVCGLPVLDRRPLLPADVRAAFAGGPAGAWIATPMHLRSLTESFQAVSACRVVVASTMPLAPPTARRAETLVGGPVLEIYGSTETGALAMRRTARESAWRPLAGVQIEPHDDGARASGTHFASPASLPDELAGEPDGSFTLLGRKGDLIKIAGRRASLAALNLLLQELPGLEDGVFYLPAGARPTERLCLIHIGPPLERAGTRRWLRERLDPVFLPRVFIRVERLPRDLNGKLRRPALDRIYAEWKGEAARQLAAPLPGAAEDKGRLLATR